ncbi:MAG: hypothetical protein ACFFDW_08155 [Candidatus Thorarchaeota archaeon]
MSFKVNPSQNKSTMLFIMAGALLFFSGLMTLMILLMSDWRITEMGIFVIVFIGAPAIGILIGAIVVTIKQKKDPKSTNIESVKSESLITQKISRTSGVDLKKLRDLFYEGNILEKKCQICKILFKQNEHVLQCPYCETLFHVDHLLDWLIEHENCPVCNREIDINIS